MSWPQSAADLAGWRAPATVRPLVCPLGGCTSHAQLPRGRSGLWPAQAQV